jgi:hypothetical protein
MYKNVTTKIYKNVAITITYKNKTIKNIMYKDVTITK